MSLLILYYRIPMKEKEKKIEVGDWITGDLGGSWRKVLRFLMGHPGAYEALDIVKETGLTYTAVRRAVWKIQNHPNIVKKRHPEGCGFSPTNGLTVKIGVNPS